MNDEPQDEKEGELLALAAIYPEIVLTGQYEFSLEVAVVAAGRKVSLVVGTHHNNRTVYQVKHLPPLKIYVKLPEGYPDDEPPLVTLECLWLNETELQSLKCAVNSIWEESPGSPIVFNIIDYLNEQGREAFGHTTLVFESCSESYVKDKFLQFDKEASQLEFNVQTFLCQICQYKKKGYACTQLINCGHVFCTQCLQEYYKACIEQGYIPQVICPDPDCQGKTVLDNQLRELVGDTLFKRYSDLSRKMVLEADPIHYMSCPRDLCQALMTRNPDDLLSICPECGFAFCSVCKRSWHGYFVYCRMQEPPVEVIEQYIFSDSDSVKRKIESQWGKRNMIKYVKDYEDDKSFREYMESNNNRRCPTCSAPIEKSMGCNKMTCGICHSFFCFLCARILDRDNPYRHYGDEKSKCYQKLFEGMAIEEPDILDWNFNFD